jgi:diguanylate cyclase (GGDEF)-like protein
VDSDGRAEFDRLASLYRTGLLDSRPEAAYDAIVEAARDIVGVPIALVSLVDKDRQWFKARVGLDVVELPRETAFCSHAIKTPDVPFVIEDAIADARFVDNPLVVGDPRIRFYAGFPITDEEGRGLGTMCVIDREPRQVTTDQMHQLQRLAIVAQELVRLRVRTEDLEEARSRAEQAIAELHRSERLLASLVEPAPDPVVRLSATGVIEAMNFAAIRALSPDGTSKVGDHISTLAVTRDMYEKVWALVTEALNTGTPRELDKVWFQPVQGPPLWCRVRILPVTEPGSGARGAYFTATNITSAVENEQRLATLALTDPLTGAANRVALTERLHDALARLDRGESAGVGIAMIDLDHFKELNDRYGHDVGDSALVEVVKSLRSIIRSRDTVARFGGDEFIVMFDDIDEHEMVDQLAVRLAEQFDLLTVPTDTERARVPGSIGIAWSLDAIPGRELISRADRALLEAKRRGRNRVCISGRDADSPAGESA